MSRFMWFFKELTSRLWVSASLYGVAAIITALAAILFKHFIPDGLSQDIGADAVDSILNILASSMLSVTIFSLSTMVSAYASATNNATPRATRLLIEDKVSHRALSTFLGTFIFSIVGIVALKVGVYGDNGRLILFVVTIGVIVIIVITLLRWIEYLTRLGRVGETLSRVERATQAALEGHLRNPYLDCTPLSDQLQVPEGALPIKAGEYGYVRHVDVSHLSSVAENNELFVYVVVVPGDYLDGDLPLAYVTGTQDPDLLAKLRNGFVLGDQRSFRQDPRFGLIVLHEIASRALSPGVNDPGTAIQAIGKAIRILSTWSKRQELATSDDIAHPRVHLPALEVDQLVKEFFEPVSQDSADNPKVQLRLQKAYEALARTGDSELIRAAKKQSQRSLKRAKQVMTLAENVEELEQVASKISQF